MRLYDVNYYLCKINHLIMPRKPKYGYARDIFGRVQERDRYKEDSAEKFDYDYSSYDREDDHSNVYDNEMYD